MVSAGRSIGGSWDGRFGDGSRVCRALRILSVPERASMGFAAVRVPPTRRRSRDRAERGRGGAALAWRRRGAPPLLNL